MTVVIIVTALWCIYILIGTFFITLNAAIAKTRKTFWARYRYAIRCVLTWPWVKVND